MSSITKTTTRSKKTKRLGPVQVLRPEQYAGFDAETKVECIQALIPLGSDADSRALRGRGVCVSRGSVYPEGVSTAPAAGMGVIPGVSGWRGNGIRSRFLASSMWPVGRSP